LVRLKVSLSPAGKHGILLIAPKGIEIYFPAQVVNIEIVLLIAPKGIEI